MAPELWDLSPDATETPEAQDEPEADGPEAGEDPLSSLDEDTRKHVEQYAASQAAAAAKTAAEEAEKRFRKGNGRWGNASKALADQFGLVVDEHGTPAVADPQKLAQYLGALGQQPAAQQEAPAEDAVPDPTYDPDGFRAWMGRQFKSAMEPALAPLLQENERLRGYVSQIAVPGMSETVKAELEETGHGEWENTPEFRAEFQKAISQIPLDVRSQPESIQTAVAFALPRAKRAAREAGTVPQKATNGNGSATGAVQNAARGAMPSASRSAARREEDTYTPEVIETAKAAGMSPAEFIAVMSDPDEHGRRPYHAMLEKRGSKR